MTKPKEQITMSVKPAAAGEDRAAEYTITLAAPSYSALEGAVLRLACDIKNRREHERRQRVINFFAGKKAGAE